MKRREKREAGVMAEVHRGQSSNAVIPLRSELCRQRVYDCRCKGEKGKAMDGKRRYCSKQQQQQQQA